MLLPAGGLAEDGEIARERAEAQTEVAASVLADKADEAGAGVALAVDRGDVGGAIGEDADEVPFVRLEDDRLRREVRADRRGTGVLVARDAPADAAGDRRKAQGRILEGGEDGAQCLGGVARLGEDVADQ